MTNTPMPGARRAAEPSRGSRWPLLAVALLLPLVTAALLALVRTPEPVVARSQPESAPLGRADLVCPRLPGNDAAPTVISAAGESGEVTLRPSDRSVRVDGFRPSDLDGSGTSVLTGHDAMAPGLVAAEFAARARAGSECSGPVVDQWFTGVGAGPTHGSVLHLTNPDAGPAIVDVQVYAGSGVVEAAQLRGIRVGGNQTVEVDLGAEVPRRGDLALRVQVVRGRAAAAVSDTVSEIGGGTRTEFLPATEPGEQAWLLGAGAEGSHELIVANGGADEARVTVQLVSAESIFAPVGLEEFLVAPESSVTVSVDEALTAGAAQDPVGLLVTGSVPVTASLRSIDDADLHLVTGAPDTGSVSAGVLPAGAEGRLVLSGSAGSATVTFRDGRGERLQRTQVRVRDDRATIVPLPKGSRSVELQADAALRGAVQVQAPGWVTLPLRELQLTGLVPGVTAVLPD